MNIVLVGLNHRTAPVELRERLALTSCSPEDSYADLKTAAIKERIYISTCNRVEVLVTTPDPDAAVRDIMDFFCRVRGLSPADFESTLYVFQDDEAVRHLFNVASSLDSLVVGEPQILGQLKAAFRQACDHQATGAIINRLMHKSFSVAKRVRSETGIASHAVSIGSAAVELARKIFGSLEGKQVLLIGAGEMAELTADHLLTHGASRIVVANRTLTRAMDLAKRWNGRAALIEETPSFLAEVDVVISSTGAPEVVVDAPMVKKVIKARKHRPLFFVDIAVPRDVDPGVNRLDNVYLYDIDDLKGVVEENQSTRSEEAVRAIRIVEEEAIGFSRWLGALDTFPTIVALTEKAEGIRASELARTLNKIGPLTQEQTEALEVMTRALTRKILHDPVQFIKTAGRRGRKDVNLDLVRRVFDLDERASATEAKDQKDTPAAGICDR